MYCIYKVPDSFTAHSCSKLVVFTFIPSSVAVGCTVGLLREFCDSDVIQIRRRQLSKCPGWAQIKARKLDNKVFKVRKLTYNYTNIKYTGFKNANESSYVESLSLSNKVYHFNMFFYMKIQLILSLFHSVPPLDRHDG